MKSISSNNKWSLIALISIFFVILLLSHRRGIPNILCWDTFGYHAYYSAVFEGENQFDFYQKVIDKYDNSPSLYQFVESPDGVYPRYTMGWAVMHSPFYFLAEITTFILGHERDGYSRPYQISMFWGALLYIFMGLFFLRKSLLLFFDDLTVALTLILITLGTSYFYYAFEATGLNHHVQFFLVACMIYLTFSLKKEPKLKKVIFLAACVACIGLTRPPDLCLALFPLLYLGYSTIKKWFLTWRWYMVIPILVFTFLAGLQLIFWKSQTGHFFVNSYSNNPGEGLRFIESFVLDFFFSFKAGLFLYFPIYMVLIISLFFVYKKNKPLFKPFLITLIIFLYVVGSWSAWWYAPRAVLEAIPLFAFAPAYLIKDLWKNKIIKGLFFVFILFNLFKIWQITNHIMDPMQNTKRSYTATFFALENQNIPHLLLPVPGIKNKEEWEFYNSTYQLELTKEGTETPFLLNPENSYSTPIEIAVSQFGRRSDLWIHTEFQIDDIENPENILLVAHMDYKGRSYYWEGITLNDVKAHPGPGGIYTVMYKTHFAGSTHDKIKIYVWLNGEGKAKVSSGKTKIYKRIF